MDTTQIEAAADEIARRHAFDYAGNYGRGMFTHQVTARVDGDSLLLRSECNACVSAKLAKEQLAKVHADLCEWLKANGFAASRCVKSRGCFVIRSGFWHMGRFDTSGFVRAYRLVAETKEVG